MVKTRQVIGKTGSKVTRTAEAKVVEVVRADSLVRSTATMFITGFMNKGGVVDVDRVADAFRMSKTQLALTVGLGHASVSKTSRRNAPKAQTRVTEMLEIISRVRDWAGGETQAMAWYRSQPIPALDGRTAEALVKSGCAHAVRDYLDHLALGGYA